METLFVVARMFTVHTMITLEVKYPAHLITGTVLRAASEVEF